MQHIRKGGECLLSCFIAGRVWQVLSILCIIPVSLYRRKTRCSKKGYSKKVMYYTRLTVACEAAFTEILMAELSDAGFDTFVETEEGLEAYAEEEQVDHARLDDIKDQYGSETNLDYAFDRVEKENWNENWEKHYEPIIVEDTCLVRASFHTPEKDYPYEVVITPKMSFGTGHHETTYLMIKAQLSLDHRDKLVMDAGCGTAILAIMACKLGARHVEAFDIDEWSIANGQENADVNHCGDKIHLQQGTIRALSFEKPMDIILANINKNVLLSEMPQYKACLRPGGLLLLSGFYESDIDDLLRKASLYDLTEQGRDTRGAWACLLLGN